MADIKDGSAKTLADGGHVITDTGTGLGRLPVSEIAAIKTTADAALPASSATDIVGEDPEAYVRVAAYEATIAAQAEALADAVARITSLEGLVGLSAIGVFEADVFESGVFN